MLRRHGILMEDAGDLGTGGGGGTILGAGGAPAPDAGGGSPQPAAATSSWLKDETGGFADGWQSRLDGELKDHASLRAIGSVGDLAKSYVETKKLVGAKIEAPAENATPEQLTAWRKLVGAPEKPEAYLGDAKTLRPDTVPESLWNAEAEKGFLAIAHKHNLTPAAVKEIVAFHGGGLAQALGENKAANDAHLAQQVTALKDEWKGEFDNQITLAGRVAATAGLSKDNPIFTNAEVVKAFAKLGKMFSETSLVPGDPASSASGGMVSRITEIQDPKSTALVAREYRGEFGAERQQVAASALRSLLKAQAETK